MKCRNDNPISLGNNEIEDVIKEKEWLGGETVPSSCHTIKSIERLQAAQRTADFYGHTFSDCLVDVPLIAVFEGGE